MAKTGVGLPEVMAAVTSANHRMCKPPKPEHEVQDIAERCCELHIERNGKKPKAPSGTGCMAFAAGFLNERFTYNETHTLLWHRDEFFRWIESHHHYASLAKSQLQSVVLQWLAKRMPSAKPRDAADVPGCLAALTRVPFSVDPPSYLGDADVLVASTLVSFSNGLVDLLGETPTLYPHTAK